MRFNQNSLTVNSGKGELGKIVIGENFFRGVKNSIFGNEEKTEIIHAYAQEQEVA